MSSFPVSSASLANGLITHPSDVRGVNIATNHDLFGLGTEARYVRNPTAMPLGDAILPPGHGNPEHRLAERFAFPADRTEIMYVVTRQGKLVL